MTDRPALQPLDGPMLHLCVTAQFYLESKGKAMATHSSTLAWKIPWTEEPGRLQSTGSLRVRHYWATSVSLFTFHFHALEKEMATHSIVLAWRILGTGEPSGLPSKGSHRVGHDWSDLAAVAAAGKKEKSKKRKPPLVLNRTLELIYQKTSKETNFGF